MIFEGKESKAMADQLATVSKLRLFKRAGILSEEDMRKIEEAIKIQLDIYWLLNGLVILGPLF